MEGDDNLKTLYIYDKDYPKPELNTHYPRLYGNHCCPFVEKARFALAVKQVKYQDVQIDVTTEKKTQWHKDINGGQIPILELQDGTIILNTQHIMDYAEEAYPDKGYSMLHPDPVKRALARNAEAISSKLFEAFYKMHIRKAVDEAELKEAKERLQIMEDFIAKHGSESSPFVFGTENPLQIDFHFYGPSSRFEFYKGSCNPEIWEALEVETNYPRILKLVHAIKERPELQGALCLRRPW
jgi:glutathione S-transferase